MGAFRFGRLDNRITYIVASLTVHWILQSNLAFERGTEELLTVLERAGIPHSLHKVVPFVAEIEPDVSPEGNVIVIGAYSMRHLAKRKGWVPGSFDLADITYADHIAHWGSYMLNSDAIYCAFADVPQHLGDQPVFMRPVVDSKFFAGMVIHREEFLDWHRKVVTLEEDDGSNLRGSTQVLLAAPKEIHQEYRIWIVDGKVITASLYKRGGKPLFHTGVDAHVLSFAADRAKEWNPARAYVLDVAVTQDNADPGSGLYIVETNTINSAGFYAANIPRLVEALEAMTFDNLGSTR